MHVVDHKHGARLIQSTSAMHEVVKNRQSSRVWSFVALQAVLTFLWGPPCSGTRCFFVWIVLPRDTRQTTIQIEVLFIGAWTIKLRYPLSISELQTIYISLELLLGTYQFVRFGFVLRYYRLRPMGMRNKGTTRDWTVPQQMWRPYGLLMRDRVARLNEVPTYFVAYLLQAKVRSDAKQTPNLRNTQIQPKSVTTIAQYGGSFGSAVSGGRSSQ